MITTTIRRVRDLPLPADIGMYPDEIDPRKPVFITVGTGLEHAVVDGIADTIDYRRLVRRGESAGNSRPARRNVQSAADPAREDRT